MKQKKVSGYLAVSDDAKANYLKEEFKGEVFDKPVMFPKELGSEHPCDFDNLERIYKKVGLIAGAVNKMTDSIVGDFTVKVKNENAQVILDSFIADNNFTTVLRPWIREGILKGNGFIEIDLKESKVRVMNSNNMYVKRDNRGNIKEYTQFIGNLNRFTMTSRKFNQFKPNQIAHLKINKIPNEPYGIGVVYPNLKLIDNMIGMDSDLHKLINRKAGAPIHVKVGIPEQSVQSVDIDDFSNKLKFMNNRTEWVTDANVEMKMIDFGNLGQSLNETLIHDFRMLIAGLEIPEVLFGSGQLNEGIAKVQLDSFQRKIQSMREEIESVIEEKIFKPILNANGLDEDVKFEWNLPSEDEINKRIEQIQRLLNTFGITENMKRALQLELAKLLGFEDADNYLMAPETGVDEEDDELKKELKKQPLENPVEPKKSESGEAKKESKIKQPEVPGAKPNAKAKHEHLTHNNDCPKNHLTESQMNEMTIREFVNIQEIAGFNYSDYLIKILQMLKIEKFEDLIAMNTNDLKDGLLPKKEIEKLRIILREGFRKNKTMYEIERDIKNNINLKDRLKGGTVTAISSARPNMIARTETVKIANKGLVKLYKENDVQNVRFLAALSDRTCPICESLNGQMFNINELQIGINQPPIHVACRCSLLSVV